MPAYERKAPGVVRQETVATDEQIAQKEHTLETSIADTAAGKNAVLDSPIITEPVYATEQISEQAFMAEELDVHLHEASDENEPQFVEVNVNGDYRVGRRGDTIKLRRYHVAVLAQAKQYRVAQTKSVAADGSIAYVEKIVPRLTYPFSVMGDSRRGGEWLKGLLAKA